MSDTLAKYQKLKTLLDQVNTQVAQCEGKMSAITERLQKEFGCKSMSHAKKKLNLLEDKIDTLQTELDKMTDEFFDKYEDLINEL